ncbi:cytochrome c [Saonia flava]|uniref:Cytochrome c n=1 Tax=Saonia flava TaxID=523696 RepID=A0A846QXT8_9FLAO|nr:ThuA domain-containing protein [Saonia flava]NJB71432.1 cytochrome c [Saonia flava]
MFSKSWFTLFFISISVFILLSSCQDKGPKVLVFSKTKGWVHTSIPYANEAILKLGKENGYHVDISKNAEIFNDDDLKNYDAVIFNCTTGNVLNAEQQAAFERYIQAGGGYVGVHSAADTEYEWPWYNKLMGAHFASHPHNPNVRTAVIDVVDKNHSSTSGLPNQWERKDEWYNYRSFYPDLNVLAYLDEESYEGGANRGNHPIAWYHEFDGGRAFYTGGGHEDASFSEPLFLEHLQGGITYAMGDGILDYSRATAITSPEENRFEKTVLINDLNTPMEVAVSDDGRIFYTELRTANLGVYNTKTGEQSIVHRFDVATTGGTGLIGITLDPDFQENQYVYLYYSPPTDEEPILFNLSRFVLQQNNTLDVKSEKVLLQVPVEENSGSHHGGSLAWDKEGNLYLSTGDSSSPFPSDGYAPLDERPGKQYYSLDAQRSASNTNDLKGKILRIHPEADGSYTIPEGNLFPKGMEKTLPEIYVMGCRNPYRIAINPKTSTVYWGEIGPDAGEDGEQGTKGYDEFNQAKTSGNYGWPYFVGNNQAYVEWDFAAQTAGSYYDPKAPINNSPNNTGLTDLPPAQPAMIWYPYAASPEFPELGEGGRSAMAGEFYTFDESSPSEKKFPEYYDGSLFVFEWMRNWVMPLRFDENENFLRAEPFMTAKGDFRRPIDLAFGKDGVMYMLEYGSVYGADNEDARLVKIEYNRGNRAPIAKASVIDSLAEANLSQKVFLTSERRTLPVLKEAIGKAPLRVLFSSRDSSDFDDDDELTYNWLLEGETRTSTERNPIHTYTQPGIYNAILKISDQDGLTGVDTVVVKVGNALPEVAISSSQNKSFFWENKPFKYAIKVSDKEDKEINPQRVSVTFGYDASPSMLKPVDGDTAPVSPTAMPYGYSLIEKSDCKACHTVSEKSVGPSYLDVAQRYKGQSNAVPMLTKKIIAGGGGNWGESLMSAHPQLSTQDVNEIVKYILSLANEKNKVTSMGSQGTITFKEHSQNEPRGIYTLTATYTDNGANGIGPLTESDVVKLRNAKVRTVFADDYVGFQRFGNSLTNANHKSHYMLKNIDLTGIKQFVYEYAAEDKTGEIEVRIDSQAGPVIAKTAYETTGSWNTTRKLEATLGKPIDGRHDIYFIMVKPEKPNEDIINVKSITFKEKN